MLFSQGDQIWNTVRSLKRAGFSFEVRSSSLGEFRLVGLRSSLSCGFQIKSKRRTLLFFFVTHGSMRVSTPLASHEFNVVTAGKIALDGQAHLQVEKNTQAYIVCIQPEVLTPLETAIFRPNALVELSPSLSASSPVAKALMLGVKSLESISLELFRASSMKPAWYFFVLNVVAAWPRTGRADSIVFDHAQNIVSCVTKYIDENIGEQLSNQQMANAANTSLSSLLRAFKEKTGISPSRYLAERRLDRAKELLETSPQVESINNIALSVGYRHQSHFSRAYRQRFGLTPKAATFNRAEVSGLEHRRRYFPLVQAPKMDPPKLHFPAYAGPFYENELLWAVPDFSTGEFHIGKGLSELFGLPIGRITARNFVSALGLEHPEHDAMRDLMSGGVAYVVKVPTASGDRRFRLLPAATAPVPFLLLSDVTDHVSQDASSSTEAHFWKDILESSGHAVWENDVALNNRFQSKNWLLMRGFSPNENFEDDLKHWTKRLHQDDVERVICTILRHNDGEIGRFELVYRERRVDGKIAHILARGRVAAWSINRKPLKMNGADIDISSLMLSFHK